MGSRSALTAWPSASSSTQSSDRALGVIYVREADGARRATTGQVRRGVRVLDRDTAAAAGLHLPRFPHGLGNNLRPGGPLRDGARRRADRRALAAGAADVQGTAARRSPPSSSTRPTRPAGFARGFSIQTVSPLPIGWAEHVLAEGHWGRALREYMRDYNHWATIGVLNELLPHPTTGSPWPRRPTPTAFRSLGLTTPLRQRQGQHGLLHHVLQEILQAASAQDTLTIQRFAHLIGGGRMGASPESSVVDSDHRVWGVPNVFHLRRQRLPHAGISQPGADDHGPGLPAGRTTRRRPSDLLAQRRRCVFEDQPPIEEHR